MDYEVDAIVIGAGVVGLAVARQLASRGRETIIVEKADAIGTGASSRNSEVIHAGIYYPAGSVKARLCVEGKRMLYAYLRERNLPYKQTGKLVVAGTADEVVKLDEIRSRAESAGVNDLENLTSSDISRIEKEVSGVRGLFSPSTGIVDSHQLMIAFQGDLESAGGIVAFNSEVIGGELGGSNGHVVQIGGQEAATVGCKILVNAAGLSASALWSRLSHKKQTEFDPAQHYAKGHYYSYSGKAPFSRPVYPVPEPGGLGIHSTPDLGGQVRFGPDVRWVDSVDYTFDDSRKEFFCDSIRKYFPALDAARLSPSYTGIRSKLFGPATPTDFVIYSGDKDGLSGYVGLHGIESPGLTSCLAIAETVVEGLHVH